MYNNIKDLSLHDLYKLLGIKVSLNNVEGYHDFRLYNGFLKDFYTENNLDENQIPSISQLEILIKTKTRDDNINKILNGN